VLVNIGTAHTKMGEYQDAINAFETVSEIESNHQASNTLEYDINTILVYNLLICYHALGDVSKMKKTFQRLVSANDNQNTTATQSIGSNMQLNDTSKVMKAQSSTEEINVHANDSLTEYYIEMYDLFNKQ